ncbi:MAG: zinc-finger domain-containing protein [Alphaproteobacteria bacterium]|nr:zinc-finger domain-containing protein [Alphaproteobacteria bacterium]
MNHQTNFKNSDVLYTNSKKISCDGSSETSKHPLIYLNMGENDFVVCPYCSRHFSLNNSSSSINNNLKNKKHQND